MIDMINRFIEGALSWIEHGGLHRLLFCEVAFVHIYAVIITMILIVKFSSKHKSKHLLTGRKENE